tara:strand:+ start:115 stop:462 length:348 start_codon:yes stop_codon:yes gene_type:complete
VQVVALMLLVTASVTIAALLLLPITILHRLRLVLLELDLLLHSRCPCMSSCSMLACEKSHEAEPPRLNAAQGQLAERLKASSCPLPWASASLVVPAFSAAMCIAGAAGPMLLTLL